MKFFSKKPVWTKAAAFISVAALIFALVLCNKPVLVLINAENGKVFKTFDFGYDDTFSVSFIHSVNQSEVVDYFKRGKSDKLICYKNKFHSFGAGMPESWPEGVKITTTSDGIFVDNLNIELDEVSYIVGTVSDHILEINGETISLRDLCGKNTEVLFKLK